MRSPAGTQLYYIVSMLFRCWWNICPAGCLQNEQLSFKTIKYSSHTRYPLDNQHDWQQQKEVDINRREQGVNICLGTKLPQIKVIRGKLFPDRYMYLLPITACRFQSSPAACLWVLGVVHMKQNLQKLRTLIEMHWAILHPVITKHCFCHPVDGNSMAYNVW